MQSDAQLIKLIQNNNFQALKAIFLRHAGEIYGMAHAQTQSEGAAKHLVQIIFGRFWERRQRLLPAESARGQLLEIAEEVFPATPLPATTDIIEIAEDPDVEELWAEISGRIKGAGDTPKSAASFLNPLRRFANRVLPQKRFRPTYLSLMVVMFTMLVIYIWIQGFYRQDTRVIRTTAAETRTVELPDGSAADMFGTSEMRFEPVFSDTLRVVFLLGEARFRALPESERPFAVVTPEAAATLFGSDTTIFFVSSRDSVTRVRVERGYIAFRSIRDSAGPEVYVSPGRASECRRDSDPRSIAASDFVSIIQ